MASPQVLKAIAVTAQIYGKEFSEDAARVYASDLDGFTPDAILTALSRCRKELRSFPAISDIIARIDDGRPGPEEAWAMIPKDEASSVVWSEEMREAFGVARALIEDDPVAARMAFKEAYTRLVTEARAERRPANWEPSLGHDKATHEPALRTAVEKNRISSDYAEALIPDLRPARLPLQIEGPADLVPMDVTKFLDEIRQRLQKKEGA